MAAFNSGTTRRDGRGGWKNPLWYRVIAVSLLAGCAPALYSVDLKYVPINSFPQVQQTMQPVALTVAAFQDLRKMEDNMLIGRVIQSNGEQIRVLPKYVKPSPAVTEPIKQFFRRAGYRVATESPVWNLQESTINKGWGPVVIGGSIDELDVVCQNSRTVTKYKAKVKLTLYFADTVRGKIFHTMSTESSAGRDHVIFSVEILEQQINTALAGAIEKLFEGRNMNNILGERTAEKP